MQFVWEIFCEELYRANREHNLKILNFILMSNHFHMIAYTPEANISDCMQQLMFRTSRRLTTSGNRINQTYAGRYFKCILQSQQFLMNAYKYSYRNPVAAGICKNVEDYEFSTIQFLLSSQTSAFPIIKDEIFSSDPPGIIKWLNMAPDPEKLEGVRYGLKRQYFTSKRNIHNKKLLISEFDTI